MDRIPVISSSLVIVGAAFMTAAIIHGRKIRASVPADLERKWRTMTSFMIFFLAGYVLFAAILLGNFKLPLELVASPVFLGGAIFVFIVVGLTRGTIGKMKEAEEKLRFLNESLERMVEERTGQLIEAQEELVRREKLAMLGQLLGGVGNELRNPLGVMNNAVFFLRNTLTGADATVREYLDIITNEIQNANRIISNFIDFFRTSRPKPKSVQSHSLMTECLEKCAVPDNVAVTTDLPETLPPLKVDPAQIMQIFQNIIANAVQAMPNGGALRVAVRMGNNGGGALRGTAFSGDHTGSPLKINGNFLEISVTDTGKGISPEHRDKIFQPLYSTKSRGIGLGLPISKNLAEANGGRIVVESELGKGTTFTVVLPMERSII